MKERPILFSAPMVRAILASTKTQTRRVVKKQPNPALVAGAALVDSLWAWLSGHDGSIVEKVLGTGRCPYGHPGDRLWVREAFDPIYGQCPPDRIIEVDYRADWEPHGKHWRMKDEMGLRRWKPSIHMPRDLSRILLEITGVRVERLQDISEADASAEGIESLTGDKTIYHWNFPKPLPKHAVSGYKTGRDAYRAPWESINGPASWDANPWVWVVEFKRVVP